MFAAFIHILEKPSAAPSEPTSQTILPFEPAVGSGLELVLMQGPPCAGKTTFYRQRLRPQGYIHVNQDTLKTQARYDCASHILYLVQGACKQLSRLSVVDGAAVWTTQTHPSKKGRCFLKY